MAEATDVDLRVKIPARSEKMEVTATLAAEAETKPKQTLADLDDDVLAIITYDSLITYASLVGVRRFKRGRTVYDLDHGDRGKVRRTGDGPERYVVHEVLGPLVFSFED